MSYSALPLPIPKAINAAPRRNEAERAECTDSYMSTRGELQQRGSVNGEGYIKAPEEVSPILEQSTPLRESVKHAVERYFTHLDGQSVTDMYDMVISEVEEPLLTTVMRIVGQNQSLAARMLGISRGTLRKKLERYGMLV
jgi:Fis family transcriptional regulator, factor for inversion stimulation protein